MASTAVPTLPMSQLTVGLETKSAKIRALYAAGHSRSDIARFLGVRYQFVRNVLVQGEEKAAKGEAPQKDDHRQSMAELTVSLKTKAEKIRTLHDAGYSRSDIARFLDIRYQHVRNVVVHAAERQQAPYAAVQGTGVEWLQVGADGRVVIPMTYRGILGVEKGGQVMLEVDGTHVRLLNRTDALRQAQAMVATHLRKGPSMVEELLVERKAAAERESRS